MCPVCRKELGSTDIFCPQCGTKLPEKDLPFTLWQQVKIYAVTVFLAPLGLFWFFKHFKSQNSQKKKVAYNVLWITIVVTVAMVISTIYVLKYYMGYIDTFVPYTSTYNF
jgi:hypothetical protein